MNIQVETSPPQSPDDQPRTLADLETAIRRDLRLLNFNGPSWVRSQDGVFDVVIVGGGQAGLGAAFGLLKERIRNILVLDESPAGLEGPWATYARMFTLRTPKFLTAIDFGIPNLTFRAWWEAQHGAAAWESLTLASRQDWMAYLRWFRAVLGLPVRNGAQVVAIRPEARGRFEVELADGEMIRARKVVLATGLQGAGGSNIPRVVESLPPHRWALASQGIDLSLINGKRVAVLGAGASAFDNAQHGLKAGAAKMAVFVRAEALPRVNPLLFMMSNGFGDHFDALDDGVKYDIIRYVLRHKPPPTNDTFSRAAAYPGFELHLGSPWLGAEEDPLGVWITTPKGRFQFDFLILATGVKTDLSLRPELAAVAEDILLWQDKYKPPSDPCPAIDQHPYLGPGFELMPKTLAGESRLYGLFAFNYSALASFGLATSALGGVKASLPKLIRAVTSQLFRDDQKHIIADLYHYNAPEFTCNWPNIATDSLLLNND